MNTRKLKNLVSELVKNSPDEKVIKDLMSENGLKYQVDPVANMTTVLNLLNQQGLEGLVTNQVHQQSTFRNKTSKDIEGAI